MDATAWVHQHSLYPGRTCRHKAGERLGGGGGGEGEAGVSGIRQVHSKMVTTERLLVNTGVRCHGGIKSSFSEMTQCQNVITSSLTQNGQEVTSSDQ